MSVCRRAFLAGTAAVAGGRLLPAYAAEATPVRVGKAIISSFPFAALELGAQQGIWQGAGLAPEVVTLTGDGRLQQALAAGSVDFGLGSGPGMGYAAKGVPARAVAVIGNPPNNMALVVSDRSGVRSPDDLKGRSIGVTTAGSLTDWLVRRLSASKGWDPADIETVPMGDMRTRAAAMQTGELAGAVTAIQEAYALQDSGQGKVLMTFGAVVPHFFTHVVYARDQVIKDRPDEVRQFLRGWFTAVAYMRDHRAETVRSVAGTMKVSPAIVEQTYDAEMAMMSFDGRFDPAGMDAIRQSLKDLGILDTVPDASDIYTPAFVPVSIT